MPTSHKRFRIPAQVFVLFIVLAFTSSTSAKTTPEPVLEKARAKRFNDAMEVERGRQGLIGLAVAVIEEGKLAHVGCYGLADRNKKLPVTTRTLFRWASVSKPVTAVAALQLVEKGKLKLEDLVSKHWKPISNKELGAVPIESLLRHQGGVGHYGDMGLWQARLELYYGDRHKVRWDARKSVSVMQSASLLSPPYENFHYSSFGYNLLGALVGRAGGANFEQQVKERIAKPLGMSSFEPDYEFVKRPHRTKGYRKLNDVIALSSPGDVSWKLPGGGFHSTVGDMARFGMGLLDGSLLKKETFDLMTSARQPKKGKSAYALGISVRRKGNTIMRLSHSGAQARTRTLLMLDPQQRRGLAIMTNSEWGTTSKVWGAAVRALGWK